MCQWCDISALHDNSLEGSDKPYYACTPAEGVTLIINLDFTSSVTGGKINGRYH